MRCQILRTKDPRIEQSNELAESLDELNLAVQVFSRYVDVEGVMRTIHTFDRVKSPYLPCD